MPIEKSRWRNNGVLSFFFKPRLIIFAKVFGPFWHRPAMLVVPFGRTAVAEAGRAEPFLRRAKAGCSRTYWKTAAFRTSKGAARTGAGLALCWAAKNLEVGAKDGDQIGAQQFFLVLLPTA
jgi:hypothetical protein